MNSKAIINDNKNKLTVEYFVGMFRFIKYINKHCMTAAIKKTNKYFIIDM